jgi:hypothetical protein
MKKDYYTDYKAGDYITGEFGGTKVRLITDCKIDNEFLIWSQIKNKILNHSWKLKDIRLATNQEIINAGFKPQVKTYELW